MSFSGFVRLCGFAAFVGGMLFLLVRLLRLVEEVTSTGSILLLAEVAADAGGLLGSVLMPLGLFGLYARQSEASGALGLVGFLAAFFGTAVSLVVAESSPVWLVPVGLGALFPGWLLFAVATLRARVCPRTAAWLLLIGVVGSALGLGPLYADLGAVPGFVPVIAGSSLLFPAAVAWLGLLVSAQKDEEPPHETGARVGAYLHGVLLAMVGLSGNPDDYDDDYDDEGRDVEEGAEPDAPRGT